VQAVQVFSRCRCNRAQVYAPQQGFDGAAVGKCD
jgi:hypothetical protein